jgi:hypothetical protein
MCFLGFALFIRNQQEGKVAAGQEDVEVSVIFRRIVFATETVCSAGTCQPLENILKKSGFVLCFTFCYDTHALQTTLEQQGRASQT